MDEEMTQRLQEKLKDFKRVADGIVSLMEKFDGLPDETLENDFAIYLAGYTDGHVDATQNLKPEIEELLRQIEATFGG